MQRELTYEDVTLFSREVSSITSRFSAEISLLRPVTIGDAQVEMGLLMSAPMFDITGEKMASFLANHQQVGVLHRFMETEEQFAIVERLAWAHPTQLLSFSVGLHDASTKLAAFVRMMEENRFINLNFLICIDTANGSSELLEDPISQILAVKREVYERFHTNVEIMAGNIVTHDAAAWLYAKGVRFVRVGISGGSVCSTSEVTGIFRPLVSALLEIAQFKRSANLEDFYIVADGGIKTSADALKALAVGADFVMMGGLLAGYHEANSPLCAYNNYEDREIPDAEAVTLKPPYNKGVFKFYRGMASEEMAQLNNEVNKLSKQILPEGVSRRVDFKGPLAPFLTTFFNSFRSSFSYCNARNLAEYQQNVEVVEATHNSSYLRKPHFQTKP